MSMNASKDKEKNVSKHLGHEEENKDLCDTCYDRWEKFNHEDEKGHGHAKGHHHHENKIKNGKEHGHESGKKVENKNNVHKHNKK